MSTTRKPARKPLTPLRSLSIDDLMAVAGKRYVLTELNRKLLPYRSVVRPLSARELAVSRG